MPSFIRPREIFAAFAFALAAASATAQTQPEPLSQGSTAVAEPFRFLTLPPPEKPQWRQLGLGMLTLTPGLKVVDFGVETHVLEIAATSSRRPDFVTTIQPQIVTRLASSTLDLRATTSLGYTYYARHGVERALNPSIHIDGERRLGTPLSLYGKGSIGLVKDRADFEIESRTQRSSNSVQLGLRYQNRKLYLDAVGWRSRVEYDEAQRYQGIDLAETLNHVLTSARATTGFNLTPVTRVTVSTELVGRRFENSPERDLDSTRYAVGLQLGDRAIITGGVDVGYVEARTIGTTALPDFSFWTSKGGLTYTFSDTFSASIGAHRDLAFSFAPSQPYYLFNIYEASVRQALFHRFDVGVTAAHTDIMYFPSIEVDGISTIPQRNQRQQNISASFGFIVRRSSRLAVYVSRWEVNGSQPYTTTRTGLVFTLGRANISERGVFLHGLPR